MHRSIAAACLALGMTLAFAQAQPAGFPEESPEKHGLSSAALKELGSVVDGYIARDEAVGAELLVIKDRKTVWHSTHGFADREKGVKLAPDSIFCVRSMTKPFVGTAVQMLLDEGKLRLEDKAGTYIASFDHDQHRDITIGQLLTHSSGLGLSSLLTHDLKALHGVKDVAEFAAASELQFTPGTRFSYSDDGTDTLAAIVEKVSGTPIAEFIQKRILDPVGLRDTIPVVSKDDARRARMIPLYAGGTGAWIRTWDPHDDASFPLFPYFLGSQAMYSTCQDYARFLCFWADGGAIGSDGEAKRLLSKEAIERGLKPAREMPYPTGFSGVHVMYAQLWMRWVEGEEASPRPVAFGHGGSDGTQGWIWPEKDLVVVYCTQSRGGMTPIQLESDIDRLLLKKPSADGVAAAKEAPRESLLGLYADTEHDSYVAVLERDGKLMLESPGRFIGALVKGTGEGEWKFELDNSAVLHFTMPAEGGPASSIELTHPTKKATYTRLAPRNDLPSADEIVARVIAAHHAQNFSDEHPIKRTGVTEIPALKRTVNFTAIFGPAHTRAEIKAVGGPGQLVIGDGATVWSKTEGQQTQELKGVAGQQNLLENPAWTFADWRPHYASVNVVARRTLDDRPTLVVRCIPSIAYPATMLVDEETGKLVGQERLAIIPGLGVIGTSIRYGDFREVGGVLLPFSLKTAYATPLIGDATTKVDSAEVVEPAAGMFDAPK